MHVLIVLASILITLTESGGTIGAVFFPSHAV